MAYGLVGVFLVETLPRKMILSLAALSVIEEVKFVFGLVEGEVSLAGSGPCVE